GGPEERRRAARPRRAPDRHQAPGRRVLERLFQARDEREGIREGLREEALSSRWRGDGREEGVALERQEERAGEAAVQVGQRDEHEVLARPDVQRVLRQREPAARRRRDGQLLVAEVERALLHRQCERGTQGRCAAVGAENDGCLDLALLAGTLVPEAGARRPIPDQALVELDSYAASPLRLGHEQ